MHGNHPALEAPPGFSAAVLADMVSSIGRCSLETWSHEPDIQSASAPIPHGRPLFHDHWTALAAITSAHRNPTR